MCKTEKHQTGTEGQTLTENQIPIENQTQAEHKMLKAKAVVDQTQLNNILEKDLRKTVSVAIKTEGKEKMLPL